LEAEGLFWGTFLKNMKVRPGIRALLETAQAMGLKVAIVSNLTTAIQLKKIVQLELGDLIDVIVTSEEAGTEKPDPAGTLLALEKLGVKGDEVVFVGDSHELDRGAAEAMGIRFFLLASDEDVAGVQAAVEAL